MSTILDICPTCKQKIKLIEIKGGDKETGQAYAIIGNESSISFSSCKQKIEWLEEVNKELLEICKNWVFFLDSGLTEAEMVLLKRTNEAIRKAEGD